MKTDDMKPGDPIPACQEASTLRKRSDVRQDLPGLEKSDGYTSHGYIRHFLPDREVNLAHLNEALADVFGEPALRLMKMEMTIDEAMWRQVCSDPWSGNIYRYAFFSPDTPVAELEELRKTVEKLTREVEQLKNK
ncbi:MAG TPA: hypothetical protein VJ875_24080 [Pyrinomonadaceae bacterium]|nr:hypothetical protein [Pyrinomonadaceae bacterium]